MASLKDIGPSIWIATTEATSYPALEGDLTIDVAVIGGGITGLTTALLLAEAGASVAVLEEDRIASSTTGYTTAKLSSLHALTYGDIVEGHGEDAARRYGAANQAAIEKVAEISSRHGIECDLERMPAYTYTVDDETVPKIEAEVAAASRLGLPASLTTDTGLPFDVKAAVQFDNQAIFHPRKYCQGVAQALEQAGGRIFELTTATGIEAGTPAIVSTPGGSVIAEHVFQATQLPFYDPFGFFMSNFPSQSYGIAIPTDLALNGMYLSMGTLNRSIRPYHSGGERFLIVGGEGHKVAREADTAARYAALEVWAREDLGAADPAYRWSAHDYLPADGIPYIGRLTPDDDNLWVATGFKKWGLTNGTVAAMIISDGISDRPNEWAATFDSLRLKPKPAVPTWVKRQVDQREDYAAHPSLSVPMPADLELAAGEGRVVDASGEKVAAYRDGSGKLHTLSAVCTHMGCNVAFNTAETTWDCPCHGSRFHVDGTVLHGPATDPLKQIRIRS